MLGHSAHVNLHKCVVCRHVTRPLHASGEDKAPTGIISAAAKRTQKDEGLVVTAAQVDTSANWSS